MKYFKRPWDEDRGDEYSYWGTSVWLFEVDVTWHVVRQIEAYANGTVLHYSAQHLDDEFGMLTDQPLEPSAEYLPFEISREEFGSAWNGQDPYNRRS